MDRNTENTVKKIASMSDGELRGIINDIANGLDLSGKNRMIANRLAANPSIVRSKLAKASPGTISSVLEKLTDEQKRELEKQLGGLK